MQKFTKKTLLNLLGYKTSVKRKIRKRKKKTAGILWEKAPDIKNRLQNMAHKLDLEHLEVSRIFVYRSFNSSSRAYARTWGFPRIWQISLEEKPAYIIEVLSERFDKLSEKDQDRVLLHEIAHIPQNFSGSLLPHTRRRGKRNFHDRVEDLYTKYIRESKKL